MNNKIEVLYSTVCFNPKWQLLVTKLTRSLHCVLAVLKLVSMLLVDTYFSVSSLYSPILQEKSTICDKIYQKKTTNNHVKWKLNHSYTTHKRKLAKWMNLNTRSSSKETYGRRKSTQAIRSTIAVITSFEVKKTKYMHYLTLTPAIFQVKLN